MVTLILLVAVITPMMLLFSLPQQVTFRDPALYGDTLYHPSEKSTPVYGYSTNHYGIYGYSNDSLMQTKPSQGLIPVYQVRDSTWVILDTSYCYAAVAHPTKHEYSELRLIPAMRIGQRTHHLLYISLEPETYHYYYLFGSHAGGEIRGHVLMTFPLPNERCTP